MRCICLKESDSLFINISFLTVNYFYNKNIYRYLIPLILLVAGIYLFPIRLFETDFSKIPGDMGDARFNNYILEHGHKFLSGKTDHYWDAPFMYPFKNVIAFSDNLLGTVPVYSFFRLAGADRETAFQWWFLALITLNFICCFWALDKWSGNSILSAVGAYIFAFSIFNLGQMGHAQVFPRFIVPLVFFWSWKFLSEKNLRHFLLLSLGIVYQFYCGVYLGFLLLYVLLFFLLSYFIAYRNFSLFHPLKKIKTALLYLAIILVSALLMLPLMIPYLKIASITGMRQFEEIIDTIPRLSSYFCASPYSLFWNFLYEYNVNRIPNWWNHALFPGILPWLGVLMIPFIFLSEKIEKSRKKFFAFISLSFFLSFIFCLNIEGFTLYKIIFQLPGFSSMRSMDRIINVEIIYFILILVFAFTELSKSYKTMKYMGMALPLFIIVDNQINIQMEEGRFNKNESQMKIKLLADNIKQQYDQKHAAIALMPIDLFPNKKEPLSGESIEFHLSAMLAAQELNIACVNAYSGYYPANFPQFFRKTDYKTLEFWCGFNDSIINSIQTINNINKREIFREYISLKASNGKYISAEESMNSLLIANRDVPGHWETFLLIKFENDKYLLRTNKNLFLSNGQAEKADLYPVGNKVSDNEFFLLMEDDSNQVLIKSSGKNYLSLDENTLKLSWKERTPGRTEKFTILKERNSGKKEIGRSVINFKASNGKYICADESSGNILVADREKTGSWETFSMIRYSNNECAFQNNNQLFFTVDSSQGNAIFSIALSLGKQSLFEIIELPEGNVALKAANGKYLTLDENSLKILAQADSISEKERFRIIERK